ncbi:biopolymer transporter ExbD [Noviherbaspirillum agri]
MVANDAMEEIDEINVIPLVDVMLVLLTIVLTTATFVVTGRIPVDLATSTSAPPAEVAPLVLTMTQERALFLNDQPLENLEEALGKHPRSMQVIVRADGRLELSSFVGLVDRVKATGFSKVSLEVKRQ